jgi:hypothetical protein
LFLLSPIKKGEHFEMCDKGCIYTTCFPTYIVIFCSRKIHQANNLVILSISSVFFLYQYYSISSIYCFLVFVYISSIWCLFNTHNYRFIKIKKIKKTNILQEWNNWRKVVDPPTNSIINVLLIFMQITIMFFSYLCFI